MALQDQAMLVNLNIRMWEARKYDRVATHDVETKHGANDAGRFNKLLIDKASLSGLVKVTGAARQHHYKSTLPWGDNGDRLLPSRMYFQYQKDMREYRVKVEAAADEFARAYPGLVQAARKRLGTLYDPRDYPPVHLVRQRFGLDTSFTPIPDAKDFRVDVAADDAAKIKEDITRMVGDRHRAAVKDMFARAQEMVTRVHERLTSEKPVIRDTLMTNLQELVTLMHAFNTEGDPELQHLEQQLRAMICTPQQLRARPEVRDKTAKAANDLLASLKLAA